MKNVKDTIATFCKARIVDKFSGGVATKDIRKHLDSLVSEDRDYALNHLPTHMVEANRLEQLYQWLTDFNFIKAKIFHPEIPIQALIEDYNLALGSEILFSSEQAEVLKLIQGALQLSAHVLNKDKTQLAEQLLGRLLSFKNLEKIQKLLQQAQHSKNFCLVPQTLSLAPSGGALVGTLTGHSDRVSAVAISSDNKYVISASDDHTLIVWDLQTGEQLRTLTGHSRGQVVAISSDNKYVVDSYDHNLEVWNGYIGEYVSSRNLEVWNWQTGGYVGTLTHSGKVSAVAISSDNKYAISASDDHTHSLIVWDLQTGEQLRILLGCSWNNATFTGHIHTVYSVAITNDNKYAISASEDSTLIVWDLQTGEQLRTLTSYTDWGSVVTISSDNKYAISASYYDDSESYAYMEIWDLQTGEQLRTLTPHGASVGASFIDTFTFHDDLDYNSFESLLVRQWQKMEQLHTMIVRSDSFNAVGHREEINAVAISYDNKYIISASRDHTLKVWNWQTGEQLCTLNGHTDSVNAVAITSDDKYAISASDDHTLKVWNLQKIEQVDTRTGHSHKVSAVAISNDNKYAISASEGDTLKVWNWQTGEEMHTLTSHSSKVNAVAIANDNKHIICAYKTETLKIWNLYTGEQLCTLTGHTGSVNAVAITSDNKYAISASNDTTLKVWDWQTGKEIRTLTGHSSKVNAVAITSDNKYVISASNDTTLKVWDWQTGKEIRTLTGHSSKVNAVAITSNNKYAISASEGNTLKVWNWQTGEEMYTLTGHTDSVNAVAITSDNKYAISASNDTTLKVWDWQTGEVIRTLTGHSSKVNAVAITSDNKYVISASNDTTLKVWDWQTGEEITSFTGESAMLCCAVASDGVKIIVGEDSGLIHFLQLKGVEVSQKLNTHNQNNFRNNIKARIVDKLNWGVVKNIRKHLNNLLSEHKEYTLKHLPAYMLKANQLEQFYQWLTDFDFIEAKVFHPEISIQALIEDYNLALNYENSFSSEQAEVLKLIQGALQLSAHVLNEDKTQLAEQLLGRLLSFEKPEIQKLLQQAQQSKNFCLVPQTPSLNSPGGALLRTLTGHTSSVSTVVISSDNKYAISASSDKTLKVWNWRTGEQLRTLTNHSNWFSAVVISSDNKYAIFASNDKTLKVWNWRTRKQLRTLTGHSDSVSAVIISSDNKYAISASSDKTLKVWNWLTGRQLRTLTGHSSSVRAVAISSDNKHAISASSDNTLKVWNWRTGKQLRTLTGHSDQVSAVVISSDNKYAISASADKTLKVWDWQTGEQLRTLTGHTSSVNAVAISSDNKYAISASEDKTLKVWNWRTGEEIASFTGESEMLCCAVVSDEVRIIAGERSGQIHFLQLKGVEKSQKLKTHDQNKLQKYQDVGDGYEIAATYHQLGKTAHLEKRFEDAQVCYQKALQIYETACDYESAADNYYNLGLIAKQQERFEEAISSFVKALNIFDDVYDTEKHGSTVRQLGKIYKILGEYLFQVTYREVMGEKCPKQLFSAIQTLSQAN